MITDEPIVGLLAPALDWRNHLRANLLVPVRLRSTDENTKFILTRSSISYTDSGSECLCPTSLVQMYIVKLSVQPLHLKHIVSKLEQTIVPTNL